MHLKVHRDFEYVFAKTNLKRKDKSAGFHARISAWVFSVLHMITKSNSSEVREKKKDRKRDLTITGVVLY